MEFLIDQFPERMGGWERKKHLEARSAEGVFSKVIVVNCVSEQWTEGQRK